MSDDAATEAAKRARRAEWEWEQKVKKERRDAARDKRARIEKGKAEYQEKLNKIRRWIDLTNKDGKKIRAKFLGLTDKRQPVLSINRGTETNPYMKSYEIPLDSLDDASGLELKRLVFDYMFLRGPTVSPSN